MSRCIRWWRWGGWLAALAVAGCTPSLNWRDVRWAEAGLQLQLPCKPEVHRRTVPLAGRAVVMALMSCRADGATFAVSEVRVASPQGVAEVLRALREAARTQLAGPSQALPMVLVPGMAPHPEAQHWLVQAQRPDGAGELAQEVLLFTRGLQVYQATVLAAQPRAAAAEAFLGSLRLAP